MGSSAQAETNFPQPDLKAATYNTVLHSSPRASINSIPLLWAGERGTWRVWNPSSCLARILPVVFFHVFDLHSRTTCPHVWEGRLSHHARTIPRKWVTSLESSKLPFHLYFAETYQCLWTTYLWTSFAPGDTCFAGSYLVGPFAPVKSVGKPRRAIPSATSDRLPINPWISNSPFTFLVRIPAGPPRRQPRYMLLVASAQACSGKYGDRGHSPLSPARTGFHTNELCQRGICCSDGLQASSTPVTNGTHQWPFTR
ncbi:hypothetical protein GQ607_011127 [Colletotrichum asianum]|uniref:Uncharacterized protein n=1 Tax=Colletotrichum asianum TaxID=702518 RepID=A0A8H3W7N7_9PEZI|nr:hypothetical protein GQ607_011127 [Colletotrichum asianum]